MLFIIPGPEAKVKNTRQCIPVFGGEGTGEKVGSGKDIVTYYINAAARSPYIREVINIGGLVSPSNLHWSPLGLFPLIIM